MTEIKSTEWLSELNEIAKELKDIQSIAITSRGVVPLVNVVQSNPPKRPEELLAAFKSE